MLVVVSSLRQLAHQVHERVKCDLGSTTDEFTHLAARAGGATLDGDQVLNFRSLAYVTNCHGKLHPLKVLHR
jgi:hypothetical protein